MKKVQNESFLNWSERVQKFEYQHAKHLINKGTDINMVLELMAIRIQKKILHYIITEIKNNI